MRILLAKPVPTFAECALEHREENFAAHIRVARIVVGHDSLRRRQHRNSETVVHARQALHRGVNPPPRLRYPLDLPYPRLAPEILHPHSPPPPPVSIPTPAQP